MDWTALTFVFKLCLIQTAFYYLIKHCASSSLSKTTPSSKAAPRREPSSSKSSSESESKYIRVESSEHPLSLAASMAGQAVTIQQAEKSLDDAAKQLKELQFWYEETVRKHQQPKLEALVKECNEKEKHARDAMEKVVSAMSEFCLEYLVDYGTVRASTVSAQQVADFVDRSLVSLSKSDIPAFKDNIRKETAKWIINPLHTRPRANERSLLKSLASDCAFIGEVGDLYACVEELEDHQSKVTEKHKVLKDRLLRLEHTVTALKLSRDSLKKKAELYEVADWHARAAFWVKSQADYLQDIDRYIAKFNGTLQNRTDLVRMYDKVNAYKKVDDASNRVREGLWKQALIDIASMVDTSCSMADYVLARNCENGSTFDGKFASALVSLEEIATPRTDESIVINQVRGVFNDLRVDWLAQNAKQPLLSKYAVPHPSFAS